MIVTKICYFYWYYYKSQNINTALGRDFASAKKYYHRNTWHDFLYCNLF